MSFFTRKTAYFLRERWSKCGCRATKTASLSGCEHHLTHVWKKNGGYQNEHQNTIGSALIKTDHRQLTWRTRAVTWDPAISKYLPSILRRALVTSLPQRWQTHRHKKLNTSCNSPDFNSDTYFDLFSLLTSHLIFSHSTASSCQYWAREHTKLESTQCMLLNNHKQSWRIKKALLMSITGMKASFCFAVKIK